MTSVRSHLMGGWGKGAGGRAARVWAAGLAAVFLVVGATQRDVESAAFGMLTLVGLAFTLVRRGLPGRIGLGLVAVDTIAWMAPAAILNTTTGDSVAVPAALTVFSLGVLLLVVGLPPRAVLTVGAAAVAVTVVGVVVARTTDEPATDVTATVTMRNVAFDPTEIEASAAERETIAIRNRDLFWHTFTVKSLDLEVAVPTGSSRVVTVDAPAGIYDFVCAIPGHEGAGMKGTITLR